ncbi:copper chaperone PCu(A)C [Litchfieldella rifensis]|uniref:Copper chaperone PCu(A)C n=1 Tax=Litchfieldella rifensis TaxID=762643 RepID=A0ABV7LKY9_9GAMM
MPVRRAHWSALFAATLMLPAFALAHDVRFEDLRIAHPFATPTPPGAPNGAAYLDITVEGDGAATLVGTSSPVSRAVEMHDMSMDDGNMRMRKLDEIRIEPGDTLTMRPGGGSHLMLLGLQEALRVGDSFPLTLEFAERGEIEVEVWVQEASDGSEAADAHHHD